MSLELAFNETVPNYFDFEPLLEDPPRGTLLFEREKSGEVCPDYLRGRCQNGEYCRFRHAQIKDFVVCKHWLRGLCKKGDDCEFLHVYNLSKMPECFFFSKYGECHNPDCLYLHIDPETKKIECPWYNRGFCKMGPACEMKHKKRTACENFVHGFCPLGPECEFGHPKHDLPTDLGDAHKQRRPMTCHRCGEEGHKAAECTSNASMEGQTQYMQPRRDLADVTCFKCGEKGHYADKCPMRGLKPSVRHPAMDREGGRY